jgi:tripartite-type tricarboxylate transporter receptor subunit TctC
MKLPRRQFLHLAAGAIAFPRTAWSQAYPSRPVRILVASARRYGRLPRGQVQMMCDNISTSIEHIRAGKLRALAVTTATRSELLPELPTVGDSLPGFEQSAFFGLGAPMRTPVEIIDKLNAEINAGLADARIKARLAEVAGPVLAGSPADFGKLIAEETEKWAKAIRAANIKAE